MLRHVFQAFALGMVLIMVLAACGESAAPATPAGATPTPKASDVATPTPAASTLATDAPLPAISGYPPERVKEMLAQNMYLSTMSFGRGETPQYGGEAVYSNKADPMVDDTMYGSITTRNVFGAITGDGGLVMYNRNQNDQFVGYLAESWTASADFKIWTFKLRPDVKFHDGDTVVAEDIKWFIELAVKPPKGRKASGLYNVLIDMESVEAIDPRTVQLKFKVTSPFLLEEFSSYTHAISHQRKRGQAEIDKGNTGFGMNVIGGVSVGPFKWDGYVKGSSFHAVRNDQYFEKDEAGRALPYLDAVKNVIITDKIVTLGAFRAGRLDTMSRGIGASPDGDMLKLIEKSLGKNKVWYHRFPYLNNGLSMNSKKAPFDDVRVRRAVALYMDREEACLKMYGGFCYGTGFTVPGVYWYSAAYPDWPGFNQATKAQDQAEAIRLVKEAGAVGAKVEQSCRIDYTFNAEFNEQLLRKLGMEPRIYCIDINLHTDYLDNNLWHSSTGGSSSGGFPSAALSAWITTNAFPSANADPKLDEWDRIIHTVIDPVVRRKALWEAEHYFFVEKVYQAPYYREEVIMPQRTYLKGTTVPGWAAHANNDRSTDWIDKALRDQAVRK